MLVVINIISKLSECNSGTAQRRLCENLQWS